MWYGNETVVKSFKRSRKKCSFFVDKKCGSQETSHGVVCTHKQTAGRAHNNHGAQEQDDKSRASSSRRSSSWKRSLLSLTIFLEPKAEVEEVKSGEGEAGGAEIFLHVQGRFEQDVGVRDPKL